MLHNDVAQKWWRGVVWSCVVAQINNWIHLCFVGQAAKWTDLGSLVDLSRDL